MDISEVAERTGTAPSTLRYYEEKGLIASSGRHGLRRQFEPQVVEQLALIALWREAGFTLNEIRDLFNADGQPKIDREQLLARADQLDATIASLTAVRDDLRHTAACPARDHLECPSFRQLLETAVSRRRDR